MMRVFALFPLERDLVTDTVTSDLLAGLVNRLDNNVLVIILSETLQIQLSS